MLIHINIDLEKIRRACGNKGMTFEYHITEEGLQRVTETTTVIPDKEGGRIVIDKLTSKTFICLKGVFYEGLYLITDEICSLIEDWYNISEDQAKHYFDWYFEEEVKGGKNTSKSND